MAHVSRTHRRGAAYLVALLAGSIVTVTGLTALSIATSRARGTAMSDDAARARLMADSGLEHALSAIAAQLRAGETRGDLIDEDWPVITFDRGQFTWELTEFDGSPLSGDGLPMRVRVVSRSGQARHAIGAALVPSGVPYDSLDTGMYAGGTMNLTALSSLSSDKVVGSIGAVSALTATITAPVESADSVGGTLYLGTTSSNVAPRRMPSPVLIDDYIKMGQTIAFADLPAITGGRALRNILLSPGNNPFGPTNALGVYVIDLSGSRLLVEDIRIHGTLVLLNPGPNTVIGNNVLIEPAFPWMPSLIVQGNVTFMGTNTGPNEATIGVNLNPPHTPFEGAYNSTTTDAYPGRVGGLIYVSGNATFALPRQNIRGTLLVGGDVNVNASVVVNITYDPNIAHLPPLGFFEDAGGLALDPASIVWQMPD